MTKKQQKNQTRGNAAAIPGKRKRERQAPRGGGGSSDEKGFTGIGLLKKGKKPREVHGTQKKKQLPKTRGKK